MPTKQPKKKSTGGLLKPKKRSVKTFIYFEGKRRTIRMEWRSDHGKVQVWIVGEVGSRYVFSPGSVDYLDGNALYRTACEAVWREFPEIYFSQFFVETKKQEKLAAKMRLKRKAKTAGSAQSSSKSSQPPK